MLQHFEDNITLPTITEHLVINIMKVVCKDNSSKGKDSTKLLQITLKEFYNNHYQQTEPLSFTNKDQLFAYIAKDVVKDYEK